MTEQKPNIPHATSSAIGIDLGTTFSAVAVFTEGRAEIISNPDGDRITPSIVVFDPESGTRVFGRAVESLFTDIPQQSVYDVKRLIGRGFDEDDILKSLKNWPFKVVRVDPISRKPTQTKSSDQTVDNIAIEVEIKGEKKLFDPAQISAYILEYLKNAAEKKLGLQGKITDAVITVPAYFSENQKKRTEAAGKIAGFKNIRLIMEPTAAALSYAQEQKSDNVDKNIMVYDFGGGTFDVSILNYTCNKQEGAIADVKCTDGDNFLGGVDFDNRIFDHAIKSFIAMNPGKNYTADSFSDSAKRRLRSACENAKKALSNMLTAKIDIPFFMDATRLQVDLTQSKLEMLCEDLFRRCIDRVKGCLMEYESSQPGAGKVKPSYSKDGILLNEKENVAHINSAKGKINEVILVGGSTRIPKIVNDLNRFFGEGKIKNSVHPDEAVALGAAYQAAVLKGDVEISDAKSVLLLDVTPLNISIETAGGVASPIVKKGTTIPAKDSQTFTTYSDNQTSVKINIYEGNRAMVADNFLIGTFDLDGIAPAPRGIPKITVTCDIDHNGILTVTAKDEATSNSNNVTVSDNRNGLSQADIERMQREAEEFAKSDKEHLELIAKRNEVDQANYLLKTEADRNNNEEGKNKVREFEIWLETNKNATREELDAKLAEINELIKVQNQKDGKNDTMNQPKVEEVD